MPSGPQRSPYPKTPEEAGRSQWATAHRLHGAGEASALFKGQPKVPSPWPSAGRTKGQRLYNPERVGHAMHDVSAHLREVDPRDLHATQPWVTQEGVSYYMGKRYKETGQTFRDMSQATNRYPTVYTDQRGRNLLLGGHHRATAALLRGEQFRAIHIEE